MGAAASTININKSNDSNKMSNKIDYKIKDDTESILIFYDSIFEIGNNIFLQL